MKFILLQHFFLSGFSSNDSSDSSVYNKILDNNYSNKVYLLWRTDLLENIKDYRNFATLKEKIGDEEAEAWFTKIWILNIKIDALVAKITGDVEKIKEIQKSRKYIYNRLMNDVLVNEWWTGIYNSLTLGFLMCITLSRDTETDENFIRNCCQSLAGISLCTFVDKILSNVTSTMKSPKVSAETCFKIFTTYGNISAEAIYDFLDIVTYLENMHLSLHEDYNDESVELKSNAIYNAIFRFEKKWLLDVKRTQLNFQFYLHLFKYKIWSVLYLFMNVSKLDEDEINLKYSIVRLYEAKYISEEHVKSLYEVYCSIHVTNENNDFQSPQMNRIEMNTVLSDIIVSIFRLVQSGKERNENSAIGLKTAQFLFRSIDGGYRMDIIDIIITEFPLIYCGSKREELFDVVRILGIYVLFDDVMQAYHVIHQSINIIRNLYVKNTNINCFANSVCQMLLTYCYYIEGHIIKTIEMPNVTILRYINTQISIIRVSITISNNVYVIISDLLKFISQIISIIDEENMDYVTLELSPIAISICNFLEYEQGQRNNLFLAVSILCMLDAILYDIKRARKNGFTDFIAYSCSAITELAHKIVSSQKISNFEVPKYINIRDTFLEIMDRKDCTAKWATLYLIVYIKAATCCIATRNHKVFEMILGITRAIVDSNGRGTEHLGIPSGLYSTFKKALLEIDRAIFNYRELCDQLLSGISELLQQYIVLMNQTGYIFN